MTYNSAEDVEKRFNVTFTNDQFVLITNYLLYGVIPDPDGCMGCDAQYIRQLIGTIQAEEAAFDQENYPPENETDPKAPFAEVFKKPRKK